MEEIHKELLKMQMENQLLKKKIAKLIYEKEKGGIK